MKETDRYTIISADAHAGLPCEEYRPYLAPRYFEAFDTYLTERHAQRDQQMKLNYDYITSWETTHEEGLRGAYDAEQRDKELDADGVAAEVIFADADAITGMESPPFGAGLSAILTTRATWLPPSHAPSALSADRNDPAPLKPLEPFSDKPGARAKSHSFSESRILKAARPRF